MSFKVFTENENYLKIKTPTFTVSESLPELQLKYNKLEKDEIENLTIINSYTDKLTTHKIKQEEIIKCKNDMLNTIEILKTKSQEYIPVLDYQFENNIIEKKSLIKYLEIFKNDKWIFLHAFSFAYDPITENDKKEALKHVQNIPDLEICKNCKKTIKDWINNNIVIIKEACQNAYDFFDIIIQIRNVIALYIKDPILSHEEIIKKYNIIIT